MTTITALLGWILANPGVTASILYGVASVASALLEAAGKTKASKVVGTVVFDAGRVTRYAKLALQAARALGGK